MSEGRGHPSYLKKERIKMHRNVLFYVHLCIPLSDAYIYIYTHIPRFRNATMITRCLKRHHDTMKAT